MTLEPANGAAPQRMIGVADLDDIAIGGAILGTGGGGDPYIGKLMAQQAIRKFGPVRMIEVDELDDDALVVPCAMMGAPTVMIEKIPQGRGDHDRVPQAGAVPRQEDRRDSLRRGRQASIRPSRS